MTALVLRWRAPPPLLALQWRVADDTQFADQIRAGQPIATLIGPPGPAGGIAPISSLVDVDIVAGTPLAINRANGHLLPADAAYKPSAFVIGLADADIAAGHIATAEPSSLTLADWTAITGGASLLTGQPYFLGSGGGLSTAAPDAPACIALVGTALNATTLSIHPQPPIQL